MNNNRTFPTRKIDIYETDNGAPFSYSMTSHKNIKVNAEVQPPLQLPGIIIFVHGVNSEGEWYNDAEESLCNGLNKRLSLEDKDEKYQLKFNKYAEGFFESCEDSRKEWDTCYGNKRGGEKNG